MLTVNPYFRLDTVKYSASPNAFADQPLTFGQSRRLNNFSVKADLSYVKGMHNAKFGVQLSHTLLTEGFNFAITDPTFNDPASPDFLPGLLPLDLTRGGQYFLFHGHTDIKQEAVYAQDNIPSAMRPLRSVSALTITTASRKGVWYSQGLASRITLRAPLPSCALPLLETSKLRTTKT